MADFAHYIKRRVITVPYCNPDDPWFAENQQDQGLAAPSYHVTRRIGGPAARILPGDHIWMWSQLYTPWGVLPPALDFKLLVAEVVPRQTGGYRYTAGTASHWFPLFDASRLVSELTTVDQDGKETPLLSQKRIKIGTALQSIRQISRPNGLYELEEKLQKMPLNFVSYRICDGTRPAFEKVRALVNSGAAVFWDRWSLPRRMAERREFLNDPALDRHLMEIIQRSQTVWAIQTPRYGEKHSYSQRELAYAENAQVIKVNS